MVNENNKDIIYAAAPVGGGGFILTGFEAEVKRIAGTSGADHISEDPKLKALLRDADSEFKKCQEALGAKKFSDIRGEDKLNEKTYYVDFVQEGGGMLGIALAGYTYILEKAGIRFSSLAGTSAGAINAMALAALPDELYNQGKTKSEYLAYIVANTHFGKFMDADKQWKRFLIGVLTNNWFMRHYMLAGIFLLVLLLGFAFGLFMAFNYCFRTLFGSTPDALDFVTGTITVAIICALFYLFLRFFFGKKVGINPGKVFEDWMKDLLSLGGIKTTDDLYKKRNDIPLTPVNAKPGEDKPANNKLTRRLVLITANLTHGRIVKFPGGASYYFNDDLKENPAVFVRASMSIPFFFECYEPKKMKMPARFADGGMLSNFPIREFHSSSRERPRCPTFGIKLGVAKTPEQKQALKTTLEKINLLKYIAALIFTFRNFYDDDFLQSNKEYEQLVAFIDTRRRVGEGATQKRGEEVNWLDFNMDEDTKKFLFTEGAKKACEFLQAFDWEGYKDLRTEQYKQANV